jgi:hypothetical protein
MKYGEEVEFSAQKLDDLLKNLPDDAILVGGQSLVFWMSYYDIASNGPAVSKDADVLGNRGHVSVLANALGGIAEYPNQKAISIIAGQIFIPVGVGQFINIDVIHNIGNMDKGEIKKRAVKLVYSGKAILIMHPLDVLESRVRNYYSIKDKQNKFGIRQIDFSIDVTKSYLIDMARRDQSIATQAVERIFSIIKSPAGVAAIEIGCDLIECIHPDFLAQHITDENFIAYRLPRLKESIDAINEVKAPFFKG